MTISKTELERMTDSDASKLTIDAIAGETGEIIYDRIMRVCYDQPKYRYNLDRIYMSHDYYMELMKYIQDRDCFFTDIDKSTFMGVPYFLVKDNEHLYFSKTQLETKCYCYLEK